MQIQDIDMQMCIILLEFVQHSQLWYAIVVRVIGEQGRRIVTPPWIAGQSPATSVWQYGNMLNSEIDRYTL